MKFDNYFHIRYNNGNDWKRGGHMNEKETWDLNHIFNSEEEREIAEQQIKQQIERLAIYQGKLGESSDLLATCLQELDELEGNITKLDAFASLTYHENMGKAESVKLYKKVSDLVNVFEQKAAYITPELSQIPEERLHTWMEENKKLEPFRRLLEKVIEKKAHILSKEEEFIISKYSDVLGSFSTIYEILCDVDFHFGDVTDENGNQVPLTHGTYTNLLTSKVREVRKEAFDKMYAMYQTYSNTIAENYLATVKEDTISASLRKYNSSLEKAVKGTDSTIAVYDNLIQAVHDNLALNHRYLALKKQVLNLDELHLYDIFVDPFLTDKKEHSYQEGKAMVLEALQPLGKEYMAVVKEAIDQRWIDVYEREGKRSGGYSMSVYGVHPYILLNYTNDTESVSTLAHELGHTAHSYFSDKYNNFTNSQYTIMEAEVISTLNEIILAEYNLKKETDPKQKEALLDGLLNRIRSTLIRQTMFAEFEKIIHAKIEAGEMLSQEEISQVYYDLNVLYFGKEVICDDAIRYEWARIPHFYRPFYVYQYATGISAAIAIAKHVLQGDTNYQEKFVTMLKEGGSKDALDLLREVDVDLETAKPVEDAFSYFAEKLAQLEALVTNEKK